MVQRRKLSGMAGSFRKLIVVLVSLERFESICAGELSSKWSASIKETRKEDSISSMCRAKHFAVTKLPERRGCGVP